MMTLQQLLDRKGHSVFAVTSDTPVIDAVRSMAHNHVGALLVMAGSQPIGIISERDYARKVVLMGRSSSDTPVRDIMSSPVFSITPDKTIEDAMRVMTEQRIRHLPVIANNTVQGVISIGDLVKCVIEDQQLVIEALQSYIQG
jgi:CBS domain-containing protein